MDTGKYEKMKDYLLKGMDEVLKESDKDILDSGYLLGRLYALAEAYYELTGEVSIYARRIEYIVARDLCAGEGRIKKEVYHV